jgi:hypothetical protein
VVGFVVVGKQTDALFDLGELFFKIKNVGPLDVVDDDLYGVGLKIVCGKSLFFKHAEQGGNEFLAVTWQGWLGHIPLHYLGIEIAVFGHDDPAFDWISSKNKGIIQNRVVIPRRISDEGRRATRYKVG